MHIEDIYFEFGIHFPAYCLRHFKHFKDPAVNPLPLFSTTVESGGKARFETLAQQCMHMSCLKAFLTFLTVQPYNCFQ